MFAQAYATLRKLRPIVFIHEWYLDAIDKLKARLLTDKSWDAIYAPLPRVMEQRFGSSSVNEAASWADKPATPKAMSRAHSAAASMRPPESAPAPADPTHPWRSASTGAARATAPFTQTSWSPAQCSAGDSANSVAQPSMVPASSSPAPASTAPAPVAASLAQPSAGEPADSVAQPSVAPTYSAPASADSAEREMPPSADGEIEGFKEVREKLTCCLDELMARLSSISGFTEDRLVLDRNADVQCRLWISLALFSGNGSIEMSVEIMNRQFRFDESD